MANKIISHASNIFSINNFWDREMCESIILHAESTDTFPREETILIQKTLDDNIDSRNNFKLFLESQEIADIIYRHLKSSLGCISIKSQQHCGVHSNLRVYKYIPGQEFKKHRDGGVTNSKKDESLYSLLIYLNDNFEGGSTLFDCCEIKPIQGRVTFFPHELEHAGAVVTKGYKYVLRGNIMFKK
jgi:prolyl 4-hydroxylase